MYFIINIQNLEAKIVDLSSKTVYIHSLFMNILIINIHVNVKTYNKCYLLTVKLKLRIHSKNKIYFSII
jgi:hypothetical protein